MPSLPQHTNRWFMVLRRTVLLIAIICAFMYLPWWTLILLTTCGFIFLDNFYEGLVICYAYDALAMPPDFFLGFPTFIVSLSLALIVIFLKRTLSVR